jgi:osmotically-inducible protein OsmY
MIMVKQRADYISGESEYSREKSNPYEMADYLIDQKINYRGYGPIGFQLSDDILLNQVTEVLLRNPHVDASEININVNAGIVFLTGHVDSRKTKKLAEVSIQGIPGVKDVMNFLTFLPSP